MHGKYSSREIEDLCRNDIRFMWLLGGEAAPDHATIARFQNERLVSVVEDLFYQLANKLIELGEISYNNVFVDGTKIEANANRYTDVEERYKALLPMRDMQVKKTTRILKKTDKKHT
jgi:transposase